MIELDPRSTVPPYDQVRTQITEMVEARVLAPGHRLPPIRQLAGDLGVSASTIARAYRELEQDGLIETKGRHGTVVAESAPRLDESARRRRLVEAAAVYVRTARHAGADLDGALAEVRAAFVGSGVPEPGGSGESRGARQGTGVGLRDT
ncbi:MAG: GntR family transcriptional regulator [Acidimicrobiales bacterium]|nr:GntR family transcriptional regulator [Acidimicrobiales bacterium]